MNGEIDHDILDEALRRCGASWDAAQSHGALSARIAVEGAGALPGVVAAVFEGSDEADALRSECENLLESLFAETHQALAARQSNFMPLLPDDAESTARRAEAIAHWSEGFLHGLVSSRQDDALKARLAAEPVADIIKDMLQITRAAVGEDDSDETSEQAYADIVEYLRVATQLVYEELDELRPAPGVPT
jgi:uncharacterized protein YgfB (UPF0149 family)